MTDRKILVNDIRVRGVGKTEVLDETVLLEAKQFPKSEKVCEKTIIQYTEKNLTLNPTFFEDLNQKCVS